jgi:hypothetical protein
MGTIPVRIWLRISSFFNGVNLIRYQCSETFRKKQIYTEI